MSAPMRERVALTPPDAPVNLGAVTPSMYEQLRSTVAPWGWTPMLSEYEGIYRAWIRHTDGRRMFGQPAGTADDAARALLEKVSRWVR